jgi:predicted anti-sigma-YlaC factor YlaD
MTTPPHNERTHLTDAALSDWLDDELDPRERADAEGHLASCEGCRNALQATSEVVALARARAERLGAAMAPEELWERVAALTIHARTLRAYHWRRWRVPLAAAGVILVLGAVVTAKAAMNLANTPAVTISPACSATGLRRADSLGVDSIAARSTACKAERRRAESNPGGFKAVRNAFRDALRQVFWPRRRER